MLHSNPKNIHLCFRTKLCAVAQPKSAGASGLTKLLHEPFDGGLFRVFLRILQHLGSILARQNHAKGDVGLRCQPVRAGLVENANTVIVVRVVF